MAVGAPAVAQLPGRRSIAGLLRAAARAALTTLAVFYARARRSGVMQTEPHPPPLWRLTTSPFPFCEFRIGVNAGAERRSRRW